MKKQFCNKFIFCYISTNPFIHTFDHMYDIRNWPKAKCITDIIWWLNTKKCFVIFSWPNYSIILMYYQFWNSISMPFYANNVCHSHFQSLININICGSTIYIIIYYLCYISVLSILQLKISCLHTASNFFVIHNSCIPLTFIVNKMITLSVHQTKYRYKLLHIKCSLFIHFYST